MAASPSVNINLSARIDLNLSISVMFPGQVVNGSGWSVGFPIPMGCNENVALTNTSDSNENGLESGDEPVQRSALGPLSEEALSRLANAFASILDQPDSSLTTATAECLSLSSPASPSFSDIDPNDLFWIPLPEIDLDDSILECPTLNDDEVVVEIIACKAGHEDEEVIFLKEVRRSGTKAE